MTMVILVARRGHLLAYRAITKSWESKYIAFVNDSVEGDSHRYDSDSSVDNPL